MTKLKKKHAFIHAPQKPKNKQKGPQNNVGNTYKYSSNWPCKTPSEKSVISEVKALRRYNGIHLQHWRKETKEK